MYCVGLTGNIASGKSTAIACFKSLGVHVIIADQLARELTQRNSAAFQQICEHFGWEVINEDGELDRRLLRKIIFSDASQRLWLENLLHPLIRSRIKTEIASSSGSYCVIEIPLLTDRHDYPYLNRVLAILSDKNQQIRRLMERDNCDEAAAEAILKTQPDDTARRQIADDLIINNGSLAKLTQQIKTLHERYLHYSIENSK